MYESRKNMGDVCEDVSSPVKECKDVSSENCEHDRDSKPRPDEAQFHLSDSAGLDLENYVIHDLRKVFSQEEVAFECRTLESLGIVVRMRTYDKVYHVLFSDQELQSVKNIYGYIKAVCIVKFKEALKGVAMYESRKIMGDVCKDVSSSIEERKDVLSEEQQHHRDSEPRQNEAELHVSDTAELGIEDYVIKGLRQSFPQEEIQFKVTIHDNWLAFPFINVTMDFDNLDKPLDIYFSYYELLDIVNPYDYVLLVCIAKFEEVLKGVTK